MINTAVGWRKGFESIVDQSNKPFSRSYLIQSESTRRVAIHCYWAASVRGNPLCFKTYFCVW